jgi:hypothetical protein
MPTSLAVSDLNRELARKINEEARNDAQSPFAEKFVGIVNGQVLAVAGDLDELVQRLRQVQADLRQASAWRSASITTKFSRSGPYADAPSPVDPAAGSGLAQTSNRFVQR